VGVASSSSPLPPSGRGAGGEGVSPETSVADLIASSGLVASEARSLLAFVLGSTREALIAQPQRPVAAEYGVRFRELCQRRAAGEPMAYLLGEREFYGRRFRVDRSVLIPRPETERLVEAALLQLQGVSAPRLIDLGTGSGCIAITLALERMEARVGATEVSEAALELARVNAGELGAQVEFLRGRWFEPARGPFDLIVSNPPYIAAGDPHLAELGYEPREALTDGGDGLSCLRAIIGQAQAHLAERGALLVEHGYDQGAAVRALMRQSGFDSVATLTDLAGLDRVCVARRH
jgi:release factor glutamine methyltransferase